MAVAPAAHPSLLAGDGQVAECGQITGLIGAEQLIAVAGKPAIPAYTAPKLLWIRARGDVAPAQRNQAEAVELEQAVRAGAALLGAPVSGKDQPGARCLCLDAKP
jgi:hypothetical protein